MTMAKGHLRNLRGLAQKNYSCEGVLHLDRNEYVPNAAVELYDELLKKITPEILSYYPMVEEAYSAIAKMTNQPVEKIVLTRGADGGLYSTLMAFCEDGDTISFIEPTYEMYHAYADIMGLKTKTISYSLKKPLDYSTVLDSINHSIRVFVVANPNGIFGDEIPYDFLLKMVKKAHETNTVILIDEVYADFIDLGISRFINCTDQYDNLVIARSFSKGYGLAGVRAGYTISHPTLRKSLFSVRGNVEINAVAVEAIKVWCRNYEMMVSGIKEIKNSKKWLCRRLDDLGLTYVNGLGNFVLIKVSNEEKWKEAFEINRIAVKWIESDREKWIRVTVGTQLYMQPLVEVLEGIK